MRVIGMISGTSFDAVEALLANFELDGDVLVCHLVEHRSVAYPPPVARSISEILPPSPTTIEQVCRLDVAIGRFFGEVAKELADEHGGVDAVCSHGQTVYHWVEGTTARGTLQLGEPAWIAELTGAMVVSDVRNRDIAAGGHGAPLASLLDVLLLGGSPTPVGSLNLGGIANVTVLGAATSRSPSTSAPPMPSSTPPSNGSPAAKSVLTATEPGPPRARPTPPWSQGCWTTPTSPCPRPSRRARSTSTWVTSPGAWKAGGPQRPTC